MGWGEGVGCGVGVRWGGGCGKGFGRDDFKTVWVWLRRGWMSGMCDWLNWLVGWLVEWASWTFSTRLLIH